MPSGPEVILTLKVLVTAVTVLLAASIAAVAAGCKRLHARLNFVFFALTALTVVGFEGVLRVVDVTAGFDAAARAALRVHLWFAGPSAVLLLVMLLTGRAGRRRLHTGLGLAFAALWSGTFVTGVFLLPH